MKKISLKKKLYSLIRRHRKKEDHSYPMTLQYHATKEEVVAAMKAARLKFPDVNSRL